MSDKDLLGPIVRAVLGTNPAHLGTVLSVVQRLDLRREESTNFHLDLKSFERKWGKISRKSQMESPALALLSEGDEIVIGKTNGERSLARAGDTFLRYLDSNFKNWGTDIVERDHEATPVDVYEMRRDTTLVDMYRSFGRAQADICFTQAQIIEFVATHYGHPYFKRYATFLPFEANQEFFVARIFGYSDDSLEAGIYRLGYSRVWCGAAHKNKVVVPQQKQQKVGV